MPAPPDDARLQAALRRVETLAHWLDDRYRLPGTRYRVGLDGIIGLIPGIGDAVTSTLAAYLIYEAWRLGIPTSTLLRMVANLGIDTAVGIVPLVGDLLDLGFKANRRNVRLLHRHLAERGAREPEAAVPAAPARSSSI
jgi:Domain of unknown function (DUF4112)